MRSSKEYVECSVCSTKCRKDSTRLQGGSRKCLECIDEKPKAKPLNLRWGSPRPNSDTVTAVEEPTVFTITAAAGITPSHSLESEVTKRGSLGISDAPDIVNYGAHYYMQVIGESAGMYVSADPQITAGQHGDVIVIEGTSDTYYIILTTDYGLDLRYKKSIPIKKGNIIALAYNSATSTWVELWRSSLYSIENLVVFTPPGEEPEPTPEDQPWLDDTDSVLRIHFDGSDAEYLPTAYTADAYDVVCSTFDGADAATAYTDPVAGAYTFVGTAQLDTAQLVFGTASLLLDGNSDYITLLDSDDWDFGTGNFTIDFWVMWNSLSGTQYLLCHQQDGSNTWRIWYESPYIYIAFYSLAVEKGRYYMSTTSLSADTWYHFAFVRNGAVGYIFLNGVSVGNITTAYGSNDVGTITEVLTVGSSTGGGNYLNGWLDELRISKGIARWTGDFDYLADTGQAVQFRRTAQLDTAQYKFATASLLLDGDSDWVHLADSVDWYFGTGDFTIDFWMYFGAIDTAQVFCGQYEDADNNWSAYIDASNKLTLYFEDGAATMGSYVMTSAWSGLAISAWHHIAFVRYGAVAFIFIDGVSQVLTISTAFSTNDVGNMAAPLLIGQQNSSGYVDGWIDEMRISKGVARWTTDFIPPGRAYEL